jgi:hypothetical protein
MSVKIIRYVQFCAFYIGIMAMGGIGGALNPRYHEEARHVEVAVFGSTIVICLGLFFCFRALEKRISKE